MPIMTANISSGTKMFVWDGEKVSHTKVIKKNFMLNSREHEI